MLLQPTDELGGCNNILYNGAEGVETYNLYGMDIINNKQMREHA
jgi:hypothetical protein